MKRDLNPAMLDRRFFPSLATIPVVACLAAVGAIVALHWQTAASMVAIWSRSETFAHGFVIIPIFLWLVWRDRAKLAATPAKPWWPGLVIVFLAGAVWSVNSIADVLVFQQLALAVMVQAAIVSVVGLRVARILAFPLAFLLFAVPAGEILVPTLMEWTADFTVAALRLTGIPVYREGNQFIIPSGTWSVVEACSGIRYIIASVMVGTLFAALTFRSPARRFWFVAASVIVPVVANWLRAYMIVMVGHLSDNRLAVGVDHIIYGWVFFGLVMCLLLWVGAKWQEAPLRVDRADGAAAPMPWIGFKASTAGLLSVAAAAIVVAGLWVPIAALARSPSVGGTPVIAQVPGTGGWTAVASQLSSWRPAYSGYVAEQRSTFEKGAMKVGLHIAYFRGQKKGSELITSSNALVAPEDTQWKILGDDTARVEWSGAERVVDRASIRGGRERIRAMRLYRIGGRETSSVYVAKALLGWSRLTRRGDDAALIVMFTPAGDSAEVADESLKLFAREMSPSIDTALAAAEAAR